jgi:NADPH:quinone reductase-like Zn-dependent oxidoreductase
MRAFAIDEFGASGSIHEVPTPEPGDGEVLVAVQAAGVNVMDPLYFSGALKDYMEHRFPLVPGIDIAGVVERTGSGVDGFAAGDEVYGVSSKPFVGAGSFAEYVVAGAENLAPKPRSLNFVEAAVVPHVGLTALAAMEAADPQPGQIVVVIGATGGVGSFVTQMASARGATVVAVAAEPDGAQARDFGATDSIDYSAEDVGAVLRQRYPQGVDSVISTHGDVEMVTRIAPSLRPGGVVVSPAMQPGQAEPALQPLGVTFRSANRLPASRLPELTALIDGGQLRVPPIKTFGLEAANEALGEMASGHVHGKLVITIR